MLLLFSHSGFSDTDANGITMKNLLSGYAPEEKAQFYCDTAVPDFSAAKQFFRVTDLQMLKAFSFRRAQHIFTHIEQEQRSEPKRIGGGLKKRKYNFKLKWLREIMWCISPWGHRSLRRWIAELAPDAVVYMVGESHFMDKLVLKTCKRTQKPLILYNAEAYRLIDLRTRNGLERAYYRKSHRLYAKLSKAAKLIIYNSEPLRRDYEGKYSSAAQGLVAYNSASLLDMPQLPGKALKITYFGNLGVGRHKSLMEVAECLRRIAPELHIDVYGRALEAIEEELRSCEGIRFHGFLAQKELQRVIAASDLLLHAESFEPETAVKLRYAFSTKIAQCLASGRCFLSYAPETAASSEYLRSAGIPLASSKELLTELLKELISDADLRAEYADRGERIAKENHDLGRTAQDVRKRIDDLISE